MNIFVYGTLLCQPVMDLVVEQKFDAIPARLPHYTRYCFRRRVYPGIVPHKNGYVDGLVYFDVTEQAIQRLDYFEGVEYERNHVQTILHYDKPIQAYAYVVSPSYRNVLNVYKWDQVYFEKNQLTAYLKHVKYIMSSYHS